MNAYRCGMIPNDHRLRHLETLIDSKRMREVLERYLYGGTTRTISACHIERIKYKPAKNCRVCYRLIVNDTADNSCSERLVYARCFEDGGAKSRYQKVCQGAADNLRADKSVVYISELETVAWIFPNDRKLQHLEKITNRHFLAQAVLPSLLAGRFGPGWSIGEVQSEMIRYIPEQSCMVRAKFQMAHQTTGSQYNLLVYGKTYYNDDGDQTYQLMRQLWDSQVCRDQKLRIPEPLAYQPQTRMLWQRSVPGVLLSELASDGPVFLQGVAQAANQVALLHQQRLDGCAEYDCAALSRQLAKVRRLLAVFDPPCRESANHVIEELLTLLPAVESEQRVVLHGDLHLKNILCDNGQAVLIDLDNLILGDPLQEIGSFVAAILNLSLVKHLPVDLADQAIRTFLVAYSNRVPWPVTESGLRWHVAAALVRERLFRGFTRLKAGRMEILDELVSLAGRLVGARYSPSWLRLDRETALATAG